MLKCDACHKPAWACAECLADMEMPKPTNADRIRGMSDEELLKFIAAVFCAGMVAEGSGDDFDHSFAWPLDWIRKPAEEVYDG